MEPSDLLRHLTRCLEKRKISYFITGSMASMAYGEPRLTNDIDVVVDLRESEVSRFAACFPENDFFFDVDAARTAVQRKTQFNIIHPASGLKIDVIVGKANAFDENRFRRVRRLKPFEDTEADFASPEDVILKKMEFYREGRSDKHIRDIAGILKISGDALDREYIDIWAAKLGLREIWRLIQKRVVAGETSNR
ncbi:MAG: nucleotidyltransferase family protein [Candidatus Aminicenantes bacterium]|nr:nucleotidyltransferase family protein [Candidatus Aminicenantes bacterium]